MPKTFADLVALMDRLRAPEGCPWDREQTYTTLAPMLLEEAYEAFEAVEDASAGRPAGLRDPHVFGDAQAENATEVLRNWEAIKAEEKRAAGDAGGSKDASILDGVSAKAPALMEAHQLSTRAARVGFDWQRIQDIFDKIQEELDELRAAIRTHAESKLEDDHVRVREELGDLLFVVTNIARHLQVEPEAALKLTNRKFRRRFRHIEESLAAQGKTFDRTTLDDLESLWLEAKTRT